MEIVPRELILLAQVPGVGPARLNAMVRHYQGTSAILTASSRDLLQVEGMDRRTAGAITSLLRNDKDAALRRAEKQLTALARSGGRLITLWDIDYPENLKHIVHPPSFLFVRGALTASDERAIAMVGTRQPTRYGARLAEEFARALTGRGFTIVSGLARGVDTLAHTTALQSDGRTIAVIGSGIDVLYPPENRALVETLVQRGALISEFPMGTQPDAVNFPRRNRIISGLSAGTLVVETGVQGGAMITASIALEQNREVFALPTPLEGTKRSGTNLLIKEGRAKLIESVDDILAEFKPLFRSFEMEIPEARVGPELSLFEHRLLEVLTPEPVHIDAIAASAGMLTHEALVELLGLELKGLVCPMAGKMFRKT